MSINNKTVRVVVFFILAIIISNIFRFDVLSLNDYFKGLPAWMYLIVVSILEGSGVLIGALVAIRLLRKRERISMRLFGTSVKYSLLMLLIPFVLFVILGVENGFSMDKHLYGVLAFSSSFVYCLMEELGWRGYLQQEFKNLRSWQKYSLIGFMWYLWHLPFLTDSSFSNNLFFLSILIFGSWGIGQVAIATKSLVACACFHFLVQIISFNSLIKDGLNANYKLIILAICIGSWIFILKKWNTARSADKDMGGNTNHVLTK